MKTQTLRSATSPEIRKFNRKNGFALVVTLSLMILLTVIAVGLLSLSSISLRSSSQSSAMATARANARLALMLAIGDLQKSAGPDQRVTARADILDTDPAKKSKNPRLTGVWRSWDIKATTPPKPEEYEKTARDSKFLGWLTSSLDNKASQIDFAKDTALTTTGSPASAVALWDKGSLGSAATATDTVVAAKIPTSPSRGALAWAVMDEGVKARINTPFVDDATTKGMQSAQLGSGERPNTESITGLGALTRPVFEYGKTGFITVEKGISRQNLGLAAESLANKATAEALKSLSHDVTSSSIGILTDTASGGLKEDMSLITNAAALPDPYKGKNVGGKLVGKGVYESRLETTGPSDPTWESLWQYARIYKDSTRLGTFSGMPFIKAQGPANWTAATGSNATAGTPGTIQPAPPPGVVLMPTVAKVQLVFSLLTRDIYNYPKPGIGVGGDITPKTPGLAAQEKAAQLHNPWGGNFAGSEYDYLLHMLYTPVVTLHNPYNVALQFTELKVVFGNVPFALQVFRNGVAQTNGLAPLDTMYYQSAEEGQLNKRFGMTLMTNGGSATAPAAGSTTFTLLPGEVILFSPIINPNRTWANEYSDRQFADWDNSTTRTLLINGIPGWRGDGIGFDLDWFCPSYKGLRVSTNEIGTVDGKPNVSMYRGGCIGAKATDQFSLKFAPLSVDTLSKNKFTVEIFAKASSNSPQISSGIIEMNYEKPTGLQDSLLGANGTITWPKSGTKTALEMHSHAQTAIKDIATAQPFAIISAQAKTTLGGMIPDGEDGKLATKPWCFAHAPTAPHPWKRSAKTPPIIRTRSPFTASTTAPTTSSRSIQKPVAATSSPARRATTAPNSASSMTFPLAPVQTLAGLNGANPGGSSGYLPRFAQPIGNSWAHPLISADKTTETGPGGYNYLDHSFLLNLALYDNFYFSGLADQTGTWHARQEHRHPRRRVPRRQAPHRSAPDALHARRQNRLRTCLGSRRQPTPTPKSPPGR